MNKKMQCIAKLIEQGMYSEFVEYINDNKLDKNNDIFILGSSNMTNKAKLVYGILEEAAKDEKLMLLDYEWQYLPHEYIKITCVAERTGKKEFTYGY